MTDDPGFRISQRIATGLAICTATGVVAFALALLNLSGRSYLATYAHDLMVFYDGAHRLLAGQVPNRDFHTPLGPLPYVLSAAGLSLGGSLGAMMPITTSLFAALLAPIVLYLGFSRLPPGSAAIVVIYLLLIAIAPVNPGEPWRETSFAMFYNRFGWAALGGLVLVALPRRAGSPIADIACIAALVAILFYVKVSYCAVGLVFLLALTLVQHARFVVLGGLLGAVVAALLVESVWRSTGAYVQDIQAALAVSGAVRGGASTLFFKASQNLAQYALFLCLVGVAWRLGASRIYLFGSLCIGLAGLLLLNQNAQAREIPLMAPAALVALFAPRRQGAERRIGAIPLFVGALAFPGAANAGLALVEFANQSRAGVTAPGAEQLDGVVTHDAGFGGQAAPGRDLAAAYRTGAADLATLNLVRHTPTRQPLPQAEYLATLKDGADLLRRRPDLQGTVFTLDVANPFNAILGRRPVLGDNSWNHFARTFDHQHFLPPEGALASVSVVMEPKDPAVLQSSSALAWIYRPYLDRNFQLAAEDAYWRVYRRVPAAARP